MTLELIADTNSVLVVIAVPTIVLFLIYTIFRYSIREKSFEDALEEQRRLSNEEKLIIQTEKSTKEKKVSKKVIRKGKNEQPHDKRKGGSQVEEIKEELKPKQKHKVKEDKIEEPEVPKVPEKAQNVPVVEKVIQQKKNKNVIEKVKEKNVVEKVKEKNVVEKIKEKNVVEKIKEKNVVEKIKEKNVVEKIKEKNVVEKIKEKNLNIKDVKTQKSPGTEVEVQVSKAAATVQTSNNLEAPVSNKKKKKENTEKVDAMKLSTSNLLSILKESDLQAEESQALMDILLSKQKDTSTWTLGKKDQLASAKKSRQEKEQQLELEVSQHQETKAILKELREENTQMRSQLNKLDLQSQQRVSRLQQEIKALTLKANQTTDQLSSEKEKILQEKKTFTNNLNSTIKNAEVESGKLKETIKKLESEISKTEPLRKEYDAIKRSNDGLKLVHSILVDEHTQQVALHKSEMKNMNAQLNDLKKQLENINVKHATVLKDVKTLKDSKAALEVAKQVLEEKLKVENSVEASNMNAKLKEASLELESQMLQLKDQLADIKCQNVQLKTNLQSLQAENDQLTEQLTSTKERVAGDGQEIVHQNGEFNGKAQEENYVKSLDEKNQLLKEKESLLVQLNDDLNKQKAKVALLSEEVETQKQKNNEIREKNWKAMEALKTAEQTAEQKIKEKEVANNEKLRRAQKEFEEKLMQVTSSQGSSKDVANVESKLKDAETLSLSRLSDYNSELEKNKHLTSEVQRIAALHETSNLRIAEIQKEVESLNSRLQKTQISTKECLQRIFPEVSIDESLPPDVWLSHFEKQAVLALQAKTSSNDTSALSARISELENDKNESASKISQLELTLLETGAALHKIEEEAEVHIKELEHKVTQKSTELFQALEERDALASEKDALQSTFQQMGQLEEMEEKLKLLQATLEAAENDRSQLEGKYDEVNRNCVNLRDQLENKEKLLTELQNDRNNTEKLQKELEDVKMKYEKENQISKELSSKMIKLNSLVKIGQDALTAEQEVVKNLKNELEAFQKAVGNGTQSPTKPSVPVAANEDASVKK